MERTYKGHKIVRNHNGKWIVSHKDGLTQHPTLADAKAEVSREVELAQMAD